MKRTLAYSFFILSGILLGAMIATIAVNLPGLSWLAFSESVSFHPVLDLKVMSLDLDFTMSINVAQIITISSAILVCNRSFAPAKK